MDSLSLGFTSLNGQLFYRPPKKHYTYELQPKFTVMEGSIRDMFFCSEIELGLANRTESMPSMKHGGGQSLCQHHVG